MRENKVWDVVVIGGGPAGMMAAGRAAEKGASVLLVEKNNQLGEKLLITGGGRCNLTNYEPDVRKFLSKFKGSDQFLFSAFSKWGVEDALDFFHSRKMETKIEPGNRVFPLSDKSEAVLEVLFKYIKKGGVTVISGSPVVELVAKEGFIEAIKLKSGEIIRSRSFILATGGKSHPETGSTGDGFNWLRRIGHSVIESKAALVPISVKEGWAKKLQGISLSDVKISIVQNNIKQESRIGKILFTHFGLSGPGILNISKDIGELLKRGSVQLSIDLVPSLDQGALNTKLQEILKENSNKKLINSLGELALSSVAFILVKLCDIHPDTFCHSVTREERLKLVKIFKNLPINVKGLLGTDKAIVTSGGVDLKEVDFRTMQSKLFNNLYLIGDILNIDRPSGGYSLQLCWTTGYLAGDSAASSALL